MTHDVFINFCILQLKILWLDDWNKYMDEDDIDKYEADDDEL